MAKQLTGPPASGKAGGRDLSRVQAVTGAPASRPRARRSAAPAKPKQAPVRARSVRSESVPALAAADEPKPRTPRRPPKARTPLAVPAPAPAPVVATAGLSEEEEIGSAKYLPRELPPRVFEEERFIFPESYGMNRVRLLVKDPHWLFAHWDIDPRVREHLQKEKGERVAALARLTLRLTGAGAGGEGVVLPEGARSWYVRAHPGNGSYRVELGLTLPSGEYRPLAQSNAVSTPRVGPSPEKATRRISYRRVTSLASAAPLIASAARGVASSSRPVAAAPSAGRPAEKGRAAAPAAKAKSVPAAEPESGPEPGGASDLFRR